MNRIARFVRKAILFAVMIALLLAPAFTAQAKGKGFKDVVKHIEKNYRAKKTRIPMLGLANFAVKLIRPAGVKGFKLAVFEDQDFSSRPDAMPFEAVMREAYNKDWQPLVQINSKRDGNSRTFIYAKSSGKDVQFALAVLEDREAVVLEVKFNPDAAARFLENPKIMGISLGNSIRGGNRGNVNVNVATRRSARRANSSGPSSLDSLPTATDTAAETQTSAPKPRPALSASTGDENNPPLPAETKPENSSKPAGTAAAEVKSTLPDKDVIRIETRLVNLNVKAVDRAGQPITDLKQEDFVVYEDGVKQEVTHFKPVNAPVNVVMLLDLSGSTKSKRKGMADAARRFIDALPPQDKIALVAFTRRYRALSDFTTNKESLKRVVEQIKGIDGGTAFYDSMWKALDQLDPIPDARKAIVVLTDGEDESLIGDEETVHTFDELLERASEEDVTIYPIYFSGSGNHYNKLGLIFGGGGNLMGNDNRRIARKQLGDLAEQTGGEVFSAQREEELESAYARVASELHTLYSLAYSPDKPKHNGEFRKIGVKVSRDGAVARTRRGYYDK
ncbi:MAG: VWA domain-containing protein [Acidobacteria bacterium]|nr:VWA domain-containing protein [Acidobacteriota bacterium]